MDEEAGGAVRQDSRRAPIEQLLGTIVPMPLEYRCAETGKVKSAKKF